VVYYSKFRPIASNIATLIRAGFTLQTSTLATDRDDNWFFMVYVYVYRHMSLTHSLSSLLSCLLLCLASINSHPNLSGANLLPVRDVLKKSSFNDQHRNNNEWDVN
jgi:hypothetical protein